MLANILVLIAITQLLVNAVPLNDVTATTTESSTASSVAEVTHSSSVLVSDSATSILGSSMSSTGSSVPDLVLTSEKVEVPCSSSSTSTGSTHTSTGLAGHIGLGSIAPANGTHSNSTGLAGPTRLGAIAYGNGTSSPSLYGNMPAASGESIAASPSLLIPVSGSPITGAVTPLATGQSIESNASSTAAGVLLVPSSSSSSLAPSLSSNRSFAPITPPSASSSAPSSAASNSTLPFRSCPHPKPTDGPFRYYTLADIDTCAFPPLDKYPVTAWPEDSNRLPKQEPSIALWFALSMDEWLEDLFTGCPAALDTRDDDTAESVPFSRVLGRLMFGQKDGAFSAITCNQNRCNWNADKGWCRGDMFASESSPCMGLDTCPPGQDKNDLVFIEKVRRWYALQALGNVWDHKKSVAAAMVPASLVVSARMEQFMNVWSSTYVEGVLVPPVSPFSAIFNIFKSIATLIPVAGPAISSALSAADMIFPITDPTKVKQPSKSDAKALENQKNFQAVKDAIAVQAKGVVAAVTTVLEVKADIKEVLSGGHWIPEHWDPVFPIGAADMKDKFSDVFAKMATAMGQLFDDSINGPPRGPNGFLTLIKGGLYSTSSMNPDTMRADSLASLIPTYVAHTEDKLLQAIMRSYGIFFMSDTSYSQAECETRRKAIHGDWIGSLCFPTGDGVRWRSLTPYTSNFGSESDQSKDNGNNIYSKRQNLHQIWPHMTADNIKNKLRGTTSERDHPIDIITIYQKLSECFDRTNDKVHHRPTVGGSSTGFQNFPEAIPTSSQSPLDSVCHWNLPVVAPYPLANFANATEDVCLEDYADKGSSWTFRTDLLGSRYGGGEWTQAYKGRPQLGPPKFGTCIVSENGWSEKYSCCCHQNIGNCPSGWLEFKYYKYGPRPGPALYYARALAYPAHPECVLNSKHISCDPF